MMAFSEFNYAEFATMSLWFTVSFLAALAVALSFGASGFFGSYMFMRFIYDELNT